MSHSAASTLFLGIQLDVNYFISPKEFTRFDPKTGEALTVEGEMCNIIIMYGEKMLARFEQDLLKEDHKIDIYDYQGEWKERLINQSVDNWLRNNKIESVFSKNEFGYQNIRCFNHYLRCNTQTGKILVGLVVERGYSFDETSFQEIPFISQDKIALQKLRLQDIFSLDDVKPVLTLQTTKI